MDEVELLRALGDVWSDATKIIESMHALRKKIEELLQDAQGDDELKEIYELVYSQIEAVMSSLRISQARIQSSVMAALPAAPFEAVEEDSAEEEHESDDSAVEAQDAGAELADTKAAQPDQESTA
jgi:hypothetical protein